MCFKTFLKVGKDYPEPIIRLKYEFRQVQIDKAAKTAEKARKSDFENYLDFDMPDVVWVNPKNNAKFYIGNIGAAQNLKIL